MLKKGKEEIIYLLNRAIEKFQKQTGKAIVQNTNRKNYEALAVVLSEISNQLPNTSEKLLHQIYEPYENLEQQEYPFRKYDITGGQIKDALMGLVSNPRSFLVDTCYIYVFGIGRLGFEQNPQDTFLIQNMDDQGSDPKQGLSLLQENQLLKMQLNDLKQKYAYTIGEEQHLVARVSKKFIILTIFIGILCLLGCFYYLKAYRESNIKWETVKKDFNLLPYSINEQEKKQLSGIWICYTGSPQARLSDTNRYHKVVANLIEIEYKDGYFLYNRFGASFNHVGYIQLEAPGLLSIHSRIKTPNGVVESPRHSLMTLDSTGTYLSAISASWNFDVGEKNKIIGIREAYQKLGTEGKLEEVINSLENASCQCKIIQWVKPDGKIEKYYLKNISLDALKDSSLLRLINENSILSKNPSDKLVIEKKQ
jgi:hypothetical protein